ncbi:MAG: holo-ACP synthase [Caldisericia bacterium]|nr:holo-ACP synthase [Caldisericia bacterium]
MIIGIGIDIINIKRFEKVIKNNPEILKRIFTENELNLFKNYKNSYLHLAGRFSLKEAIIKAGKNYLKIKSFKDIEILKDNDNKPILIKPQGNISISISHDGDYVISIAIIEK